MKDWDENKLDQELENLLNDIPEQDDLDKRIEKYINRRIRKTIHKTLATLLVIALVLLLFFNPIMNASFYNPAKDEAYFFVMRDYIETTRPYAELLQLDVSQKGFSYYELEMDFRNHFSSHSDTLRPNIFLGKMRNMYDGNHYFTAFMRFGNHAYTETENGEHVLIPLDKERYVERLSKLPDSAIIYLSLTSVDTQSLTSLREKDFEIEWVEIYQPNVEFQGGISLNRHGAYDETDYRRSMSDAELLHVYVENLQNLIDHHNMWKQFELPSSEYVYASNKSFLQETLDDAKALTQIETRNYSIYGEKEAILEHLENTELESIVVEEVRLY